MQLNWRRAEPRPQGLKVATVRRLVALAVIQGTVGLTALYALSVLLPALAGSLGVPIGLAAWVPWAAQAGLMVAFVAWQLMAGKVRGRRVAVALAVVLAGALFAGSLAPSAVWLLLPAPVVGVGTLLWAVLQARLTELSLQRGPRGATLVQWLGSVMLTTGAAGRYALVELASACGWRWAVRALAIAAVIAAIALWGRWFVFAGPLDERTSPSPSRQGRRAGRWGAAVVVLSSVTLSALDYYEPAALELAGHGYATGPMSLAYPISGLAAALTMAALSRHRGVAVVAAAVATFAGAGCQLVGELAFAGTSWLVLQVAGRLFIQSGTTLLTLSLAAILAERYGCAERFARTFAFWRAAASVAAGGAGIPLWSCGQWLGVTTLAAIASGLALVAATGLARSQRPVTHVRHISHEW